MQLSLKAWSKILLIIKKIKAHPFTQELAKGTLKLDKFSYYLEQDSSYLKTYANCCHIIGSKAPLQYQPFFLRTAQGTIEAEQDMQALFQKNFDFKKSQAISPAQMHYAKHIHTLCSTQPYEIGFASLLPCFWVYYEVGLDIIENATQPNNPFAPWIETYIGQDHEASVKNAIRIFDELALKTTSENREKMIDAFYKSAWFEWHFWNNAYHKHAFTPKRLDISKEKQNIKPGLLRLR